jgi:hypothetical protein
LLVVDISDEFFSRPFGNILNTISHVLAQFLSAIPNSFASLGSEF